MAKTVMRNPVEVALYAFVCKTAIARTLHIQPNISTIGNTYNSIRAAIFSEKQKKYTLNTFVVLAPTTE
jgi:hypothetical protein